MQKDDALERIRERFVRPFYLALLHGNLRRPDLNIAVDFPARIGEAAKGIADAELATLLEEGEWRGRLAAAWFIGITRRRGFVDAIGRLLLASELTYAGQGYCVALGLIAEPSCEEYLRSYLRLYLPPRGRFYDQTWAIGALAHLRRRRPDEFLEPTLWRETDGGLDPEDGIKDFDNLVSYLVEHGVVAAQPSR
jgi:hypothetical protein